MLDDLFSHKIHATRDLEGWQRRLVKLATIFEEFDGQEFDRDAFDNRLKILAPEAARSPFRDQYSIYLPIFGVGQVVWERRRWVCRLSATARIFLCGIEPDVEAFARLQLALSQRPDGRGQDYRRGGLRLEHQAARKTIELIKSDFRLCPFRLILRIVEAKATIEGLAEELVQVTPREIYALANTPQVYRHASPPVGIVEQALRDLQAGRIQAPRIGRQTFSFLESTGLLLCDRQDRLVLRPCVNEGDRAVRDRQVNAIRNLEIFYDGFGACEDSEQLRAVLQQGDWARYLDACRQLPSEQVELIAGVDHFTAIARAPRLPAPAVTTAARAFPSYPGTSPPRAMEEPARRGPPARRLPAGPAADPEVTRVKRERRNAYHEMILRIVKERVERYRLTPRANEYIDLVTSVDDPAAVFGGRFKVEGSFLDGQKLPYFPGPLDDGVSFLFEVKSSDDQIVLDQIRKAVGQLYEYHYRHQRGGYLKKHVVLIIAMQTNISRVPWLKDYLLKDRAIGVCWVNGNNRLLCPKECLPLLGPFVDGAA